MAKIKAVKVATPGSGGRGRPRNLRRPTNRGTYQKYTKETLEEAVKEVKAGTIVVFCVLCNITISE